MSNNNNSSIFALIAGAAIGATLGILFAPDKGSKTREKIIDGFDDLKDIAKSKFENFEDQAKEMFSEKKHNLKDTVEELISSSSYKAEEAISFLEEKLADLKKLNTKLQK